MKRPASHYKLRFNAVLIFLTALCLIVGIKTDINMYELLVAYGFVFATWWGLYELCKS